MTVLRVLIVEDDPRIADLHRRFTERVEGYEVVGVAADLDDAHEQSAVLEPDLILLDLYFPGGNGLDLLRRLRAEGRALDVILVTAAKEVATLQDAVRGGAFDYIIKPVVFSRFADALAKFRAFRRRLDGTDILEQSDVDRLLSTAAENEPGVRPEADLPKGIDPLTLKKVDVALADTGVDGLSADELAAGIGTSRSTARRYLEYLVGVGVLEADVAYGTVGRPQRRYRRL